MDAGIPMPAFVSSMPMPSFGIMGVNGTSWQKWMVFGVRNEWSRKREGEGRGCRLVKKGSCWAVALCVQPLREEEQPPQVTSSYYFMAAPCQSDQGNLRIKTNTCTAHGSLNKGMLLKGTLAWDFLLLIYFLLLIFSSIVLNWSSDCCPQLFSM